MSAPVWLLDVDGVLNAPRAGWGGAPMSATVDGYRLHWSPELMDRIYTLWRNGTASIQWATSWAGRTRAIESAFGLPRLGDAFDGPVQPPALLEKHAAAAAVDQAGRRLVWTDDEAFDATPGWADRLAKKGHLLIRPDPRRGLRPRDLDRIAEYCLSEVP